MTFVVYVQKYNEIHISYNDICNFIMIFIHEVYRYIPTYRLTLSGYPTGEKNQIGVALLHDIVALAIRIIIEDLQSVETITSLNIFFLLYWHSLCHHFSGQIHYGANCVV